MGRKITKEDLVRGFKRAGYNLGRMRDDHGLNFKSPFTELKAAAMEAESGISVVAVYGDVLERGEIERAYRRFGYGADRLPQRAPAATNRGLVEQLVVDCEEEFGPQATNPAAWLHVWGGTGTEPYVEVEG